MAQNFINASVDAIDFNPAAIQQSEENFVASPFAARMRLHLTKIQNYFPLNVDGSEVKYNIIATNPPFYPSKAIRPPSQERAKATVTVEDDLSYEDLLNHSSRLLCASNSLDQLSGLLVIILPSNHFTESQESLSDLFQKKSIKQGLKLLHRVHMHDIDGKPAVRHVNIYAPACHDLPEFSESHISVYEVIKNDKGEFRQHSTEIRQILQDFLLERSM